MTNQKYGDMLQSLETPKQIKKKNNTGCDFDGKSIVDPVVVKLVGDVGCVG